MFVSVCVGWDVLQSFVTSIHVGLHIRYIFEYIREWKKKVRDIIKELNKNLRYVLFCRVKWRMSNGCFKVFGLSFFHKYLLCLPLLKIIGCVLCVYCNCFVSSTTKEMYCCISFQVAVHLKLHYQCKRMCRSSLNGCLQFILTVSLFFVTDRGIITQRFWRNWPG